MKEKSSASSSSSTSSLGGGGVVQQRAPRLATSRFSSYSSTSSSPVEVWIEMLLEAQRNEKPLKLIRGVTKIHAQAEADRKAFWPEIFKWATSLAEDFGGGDVASDAEKRQVWYQEMKSVAIPKSEVRQIEKDLPRTVKWLSDGEIYNPFQSPGERNKHISELRRVLNAWVALQIKRAERNAGEDIREHQNIYVQGLNGVGYCLLEVFDDDEPLSFLFLEAISHSLLPMLFATQQEDIFGVDSIRRTSEFFETLLLSQFPSAVSKCRGTGLSAGFIACKWLLTMFSNISFSSGSEGDDALPFEVVKVLWDVVFAFGVAGLAAVVICLFGTVKDEIERLPGSPPLTEDLIGCFTVLRHYSASAFCADAIDLFENCNEPLFTQLVKTHMRKCKKAAMMYEARSPVAPADSGGERKREETPRNYLRRKLSFDAMLAGMTPGSREKAIAQSSDLVSPTALSGAGIISKIDKLLKEREKQPAAQLPIASSSAFVSPRPKSDAKKPPRAAAPHCASSSTAASVSYKKAWKDLHGAQESGGAKEKPKKTSPGPSNEMWREAVDEKSGVAYYWRYRGNEYESTWQVPTQGYTSMSGKLILPRSRRPRAKGEPKGKSNRSNF